MCGKMKITFISLGFEFLAAIHRLEDAAVTLRIVFGVCLAGVFFAGVHVFRKRQELFGRDPQVTTDTWAARNLRFWQVLLIWILTMDLLIEMLWRLR
jgi:hypothetical protein